MISTSPNATSPLPSAIAPIPQFEAECVQFFAEVVQIFGIPRSVGQIYGLLYASPRPLGFLDIVETLEISKGSASQGMQLLRELGAINEVVRGEHPKGKANGMRQSDRKEGRESKAIDSGDANRSARVVYEPELSLRRLVSGMLRERIAPMAATSADRLTKLRELAEEQGAAGIYLARAKQLNTWRRRLRAILPVLGALLGPTNE